MKAAGKPWGMVCASPSKGALDTARRGGRVVDLCLVDIGV